MGLFDLFKTKDPLPGEPKKAPVADAAADKALARAICEEIRAKEAVRLAVRYALEEGEPGIFESKVGGTPYLPHEEPWPLDGKGGAMDLLAQVDCAALAGLPDFPHGGLLQFFLARDDTYGMDFDDGVTQAGFRVVYRESVDRTVTAEEVRAKRPPAAEDDEEYYSPVFQPCRMVFSGAEPQGITENDYRFARLFLERWNARRPDAPLKHLWDFFSRMPEAERDYEIFAQPEPFRGTQHRVGGWPYFTQDDPRYNEIYQAFDILLFQLDSDFDQRRDRVMWGDSGVGNFFISREALKNRDFSRVLYNWDCC